MTHRTVARRLVVPGLALLTAAMLSSCVHVPTGGPVVEEQASGQGASVEGPFTHPPPPKADDSPQEIVKGFLNAMTATPIQINVARKFLTRQAQVNWRPLERTVVYTTAPVTGGSEVTMRLRGAHTLGVRGDWEGPLPHDQSTVVLPMRPETAGWRIARAPDAFIVPELWYQQHFQSATLYFFDPTGRILVPEPVHVPEGDQLPSILVRALLLGPPEALGQVARSFIPPGLSPQLSVTVTPKGVAEVTLKGGDPGPLPKRTTELMLAQLAWTLRQEPTIKAFQVKIAGTQVSDATGSTTFSVNGYDRFDPTVSTASAQLYALRRGRLVSGQAKLPTPVDGPFGTRAVGIGAFAVSLDDTRIAGVTPFRLLTGAVRGGTQVHEVYSGSGPLLRPSWDFAGRLWDIEQSPHGARVVVVTGGKAHPVQIPGVTGENVVTFLVSRDGSRLVAVVHGPRADRLVVSRIRYDAQGRARGGTDTRNLPWEAGGSPRIIDVGWASPTTVDVLHQLTHQFAEVRRITVDGSTPQSEASTATIDLARQGLNVFGQGNLPGRVRGLVTSPVETQTSFAILPHSLVDLDQSIGAVTPVQYRALQHITYAG
jgi:hypothetical protein